MANVINILLIYKIQISLLCKSFSSLISKKTPELPNIDFIGSILLQKQTEPTDIYSSRTLGKFSADEAKIQKSAFKI